MELRKDPITRSWVVVGHREDTCETTGGCPFCPEKANSKAALLRLPSQGHAQVAVFPHPDPLYRVEGEPDRRADGIYDQMQPVGADEIVIETPGPQPQARGFDAMTKLCWSWKPGGSASRI